MRPSVLFLAAAALAAACLAQVTQPPPVCFALNDTSPTPPSQVSLQTGSTLWIHFTTPVSAAIDRIEVFAPAQPLPGPNLAIAIHRTLALGVPPSTTAIGTLTGVLGFSWSAASSASPIALTMGSTYALAITISPLISTQTCGAIFFDSLAPHQLPYLFAPSSCTPGFPLSGVIGLGLRFRGLACSPGPLASVAAVGQACVVLPGGYLSNFSSFTPPILGSAWPVSLSGPPGNLALLFWSVGVNAGGSLITPGLSCLHYLDPASVATLAAGGFEPFITSTVPASGFLNWIFAVPANPNLAGTVLGLQVMLLGPNGTIPLGGGLFGQTTRALQLTLGY